MAQISTFVFFDIETTGLPFQEMNRTKITELCLLAVGRRCLEMSDTSHPVSKLTLVFNPGRKIHPTAEILTGLTNDYLKNAPTFAQKGSSIINFLNELTKPVCLVAHNGNAFDYKILLAECNDVRISLPDDLLCVDTLAGFRKLLKEDAKIESSSKKFNGDNHTAEENMWPELNVNLEDWQEIDDMCTFLIDISCYDKEVTFDKSPTKQEYKHNEVKDTTNVVIQENKSQDLKQKRCAILENIFGDSDKSIKSGKSKNEKTKCIDKPKSKIKVKADKKSAVKKGGFTLSALYERILDKKFVNAHRAEGDCYALLEVVTAMKDNFLPWIDSTCKRLTEITPLIRH